MRLTKPRFLLLIALALIAVTAYAQEHPQPDRWRGLVLDQSSPDDAMKALGQPKSDKPGGIYTYPLNQRLTLDHNSKGFRRLEWEKIEGVKNATLIFQENKLVFIQIKLDKPISATSLPDIYNLEFTPKFSGMDQVMAPGNYERNQGRVYPVNYPVTYHLIGTTEKVYVSALVSNSGIGALLVGNRRDTAGPNDRSGFPGKIELIQLISRALENHAGEDVLK